jgi:multidrug efflux system membrane fusion protein
VAHRFRLVASLAIVAALAGYGYWRWNGVGAGSPAAAVAVSQAAGVAVTTAIASEGTFPIRRRTIGVIESPAQVTIKSRIDSQIVEQHVTDGQIVRKGDLLFSLDDREVLANIARDKAALEKDRATFAKAEADLNRVRQLIARNAAAQVTLDAAVADAKAAEATIAGDQAALDADQLRLTFTRITAPISGRLGTVRVTPGNLVSANDSSGAGLVTITQVRPVRVAFSVPERDLELLRKAYWRKPPAEKAAVRVFAPGSDKVLAEGKLDFIDSSVETASGTITAKATFPNERYRLVPGQYVDVEIDLDSMPNVVTIPTIAMQTGQTGPFVFTVMPDKTVDIRPITLLGSEGDRIAIETGVSSGDHVVVEGQLRLDKGTKVVESVRQEETAMQVPQRVYAGTAAKAVAERQP